MQPQTSLDNTAPLTPPASDYWSEVRRPWTCLLFLAPLVVLYEAGIFWIGGAHVDGFRNGADFWLRGWLQQIGAGSGYLPPALLLLGLLAWQIAGRHPWSTSPGTIAGMIAESLLFAFALILLGQLNDLAFRRLAPALLSTSETTAIDPLLVRTVSFIGAGVYEEFLFRLCLLPLCYGGFRLLLVPKRGSAVLAILVTSLVFSAAHYLGPLDDVATLGDVCATARRIASSPALWQSFSFRTLAGLFFAALFCIRGFGITVGCHAVYDVLVGVLMTTRL